MVMAGDKARPGLLSKPSRALRLQVCEWWCTAVSQHLVEAGGAVPSLSQLHSKFQARPSLNKSKDAKRSWVGPYSGKGPELTNSISLPTV